jgi:hypothetical protein
LPDPTYSLLIGTADPKVWRDGLALLGRIVMARGPGIETDENEVANLNLDTLRWIEPLEDPSILPRTTTWSVGAPPPGEVGQWVNLRVGLDIYNASDTTPDQNQIGYTLPAAGWQVEPSPQPTPRLLMYQVQRQDVRARIDPLRAQKAEHAPTQLQFQSGFDGSKTPVEFVVPVTVSVRRSTPLNINGSLSPSEWVAEDALQRGPLVKMFSRPALQKHQIERSSHPTEIYSGWSDTDFYLAFRLAGISERRNAARNFVEYQYRRAWSEDLCQMVVQAVYEDGTLGPLVHIALKPGGNLWTERRLDPRLVANPWQSFESGMRYSSSVSDAIWRGELASPWKALIADEKTAEFSAAGRPNRPAMLKFNFVQHSREDGESASWAGPIDAGRDDAFTGVVVLKEPEAILPADNAR